MKLENDIFRLYKENKKVKEIVDKYYTEDFSFYKGRIKLCIKLNVFRIAKDIANINIKL